MRLDEHVGMPVRNLFNGTTEGANRHDDIRGQTVLTELQLNTARCNLTGFAGRA
jgi:hypothetical protein